MKALLLALLLSITPTNASDTRLVPKPGSTKTSGGGGGAVTSVNGQTGVVSLNANDVGAATQALDNLGTTSFNASLFPDSNNSRSIGSAALAINTTFSNIFTAASAGVTAGSLKRRGVSTTIIGQTTTTSDLDIAAASTRGLNIYTANSGGLTSERLVIATGDSTSGGDTGAIYIGSGDSTAGNSGHINLLVGAAGGTRGSIKFKDGTEGTIGHCWKSTDTDGNGHWASCGGSVPDPLQLTDGSETAPSYSFSSDTNTGIYRVGTDEMGFASNNYTSMKIGYTNGVTFYNHLRMGLDNTLEIGSTTATLLTVFSRNFQAVDPSLNTGTIEMEAGSSTMIVSGSSVQGKINAPDVTSGNKSIGIQTAANSTNNSTATGSLYFETGGKGAGTGNSGSFFFQSGASSGGTRGTFNVNAHIVTAGSSPSLSSCGTSPTISGNDNAGKVTIGTGGVTTTCVLTFNQTWTTAPSCFANNETSIVLVQAVSTTTTVTLNVTLPFGASDVVSYNCVGY